MDIVTFLYYKFTMKGLETNWVCGLNMDNINHWSKTGHRQDEVNIFNFFLKALDTIGIE